MKPARALVCVAVAATLVALGWARVAEARLDDTSLGQHSDTQGPVYLIGALDLFYANEHELQPPAEELMLFDLALGEGEDGLVGPRRGGETVWFSAADVANGPPVRIYASGIRELNEQLVRELQSHGLIGVFVAPDPNQIDPATGLDLRPRGEQALRLIIYTGQTEGLRTFVSGPRPESQPPETPSQEDIRRYSPVQPAGVDGRKQGDLLFRGDLDRYVSHLNRHPGRRVDVAVTPTRNPGGVYVDYVVAEDRPWTAYAQVSNTGTDQTTDWRQRFGYQNRQLSGRDDILQLDYVTGNFDDVNAALGSYELPVPWFERTRIRASGLWSDYDASQYGAPSVFEGTQWNLGTELVANVYQREDLFLDFSAGVRWMDIETENANISDDEQYFVPRLGLSVERFIDTQSLAGFLGLERNLDSVAGTDAHKISTGRVDMDDDWMRLLWNGSYSFYLEPLLNARAWRNPHTPTSSTLTHEIALRTQGQFSLGTRLIPQAEAVLGGFYTVRGYPEAIIASDNAYLFSAEYRYHWPRSFRPRSEPHELPLLGKFHVAPARVYGRPDWDLVFRVFYDWARATYTDSPRFNGKDLEEDKTLAGSGLGIELVLRRYLSLRLDHSVALRDLENRSVDSGDTETHFLATLRY